MQVNDINYTTPSSRNAYHLSKRIIDIVLSGLALIILSPIFIPLMIMLRLTGEGYVFYTQKRVGFKNREFNLLKFATMLKNSPSIGTGTITTKNDPRVLPLGKFLRKTKINELPQIINVLKGDMSIVGPRPQTMECFMFFPENRRDKIYLSKPGLTGIGSLVFRNEEDIIGKSSKPFDRCYKEDIMPYKADLELWYLENKSLWIDIKIITLTAIEIIFPETKLYKLFFSNLPLSHLQKS